MPTMARTCKGQARANRPALTHLLAQEWIAAMPDVDARLQADPPARIADIGMGQGWSSIALARAYPKARIDGFDLDEASVEAARRTSARPASTIGSPMRARRRRSRAGRAV